MKITWNLGDVIGKVRELIGKTRAQLAEMSGLSAYRMGVIERTGNCRNSTLARIANALDVEIQDIYANVPKTARTAAEIGICKEHLPMFRKLDEILHADERLAEWISGNIHTFHAQAKLGAPPEGNDKRYTFSPIKAIPAKKRKKFL